MVSFCYLYKAIIFLLMGPWYILVSMERRLGWKNSIDNILVVIVRHHIYRIKLTLEN